MELMAREGGPQDDVALMVLSLAPRHAERFRFAAAAEPQHLAPLRRALARWLSEAGATKEETDDVVLAISEAAANAVLHAYGPEDGVFEVAARAIGGVIDATVRDRGRWRSRGPDQGGRGLRLMRALVDAAEVSTGPSGTEVKLVRRLGRPLGALPPAAESMVPAAAAAPRGSNGPEEPEGFEGAVDRVAVVRITEEMDFSNAEPMGVELARAVSSEHLGLVVDLSEVTLLDSSGLRLLFRLGRRLERRRQQLRVVVPLTSPVRRVLDIAGIWTGSHVARSVEEAVASIRDHPAR
jgi:anti-anti-sigma factor